MGWQSTSGNNAEMYMHRSSKGEDGVLRGEHSSSFTMLVMGCWSGFMRRSHDVYASSGFGGLVLCITVVALVTSYLFGDPNICLMQPMDSGMKRAFLLNT